MIVNHLCPKCGKQMVESPKWPGCWQCPDYGPAIGRDATGKYLYKCTGLEITEAGCDAFEGEIQRMIQESN